MDHIIRMLSVALARNTTRRDFLASLLKGLVTLGLSAAGLFGGNRYALAHANITYPCTGKASKGDCGRSSCTKAMADYWPGTICTKSDKLCQDLNPAETCGTTEKTPCPTGRTIGGYWVCCCKIGDKNIYTRCFLCLKGVAVCKCFLVDTKGTECTP